MRVLSWNLYRGGLGAPDRLESSIEYCASVAADVVLFQEACSFTDSLGSVARDVAERLGMSCFLAYARSGYHVAGYVRRDVIAVAWAIQEPLFHSAVGIRLNSPTVGDLCILGVHLCPDMPARRSEEIRWLLDRVNPGMQTLLIGDFNSPDPRRDGRSVQELGETLRRRYVAADGSVDAFVHESLIAAEFADLHERHGLIRNTFPTDGPISREYLPMRLDYAYASKELADSVAGFKVLTPPRAGQLSDHYPILVTLGERVMA